MKSYFVQFAGTLFVFLTMSASATVHYVDINSTIPTPPYITWANAATNIQDAIDAASDGEQILVTNGVYMSGGDGVNRVSVTKPLTLQSVNGPELTVIDGGGAVRCVLLGENATLMGFTLTKGAADWGGGAGCTSASAVITNCLLTGNSASSGGSGGGASGGTLNNCTITANSAGCGGGASDSALSNCLVVSNSATYGGGAYIGTLNNCTVISNSAGVYGGGVSGFPAGMAPTVYAILRNCIVYDNQAPTAANYFLCNFKHSCTSPIPEGIGNFDSPPLLVDPGSSNFRLQSNSPCVNSGYNAYAPAGLDLDGNPRIVGGTVDIGAYEFQTPASLISYAWLQQFGLSTDGKADYADPDGDGMNNWQEWRAGTNPTNAMSVLQMLLPTSGVSDLTLSWQSVSGLNYFLERGTDFGAQPPFLPLASNIVGQPGTTTFTDTNAGGAGPYFYRVGVSPP